MELTNSCLITSRNFHRHSEPARRAALDVLADCKQERLIGNVPAIGGGPNWVDTDGAEWFYHEACGEWMKRQPDGTIHGFQYPADPRATERVWSKRWKIELEATR